MTSPTFTVAALVDELEAIACPVERAAAASRVAEELGCWPPQISRVRWEAFQEARDTGSAVLWLAKQFALTRGRIYQLTITRRGRQVEPGASTEAHARVQTAAPHTSLIDQETSV